MLIDQTLRELAQSCNFQIGSSLSPVGVVKSADYRNVVAQHFNLLVPAGTLGTLAGAIALSNLPNNTIKASEAIRYAGT
jgi:hypothetical protein